MNQSTSTRNVNKQKIDQNSYQTDDFIQNDSNIDDEEFSSASLSSSSSSMTYTLSINGSIRDDNHNSTFNLHPNEHSENSTRFSGIDSLSTSFSEKTDDTSKNNCDSIEQENSIDDPCDVRERFIEEFIESFEKNDEKTLEKLNKELYSILGNEIDMSDQFDDFTNLSQYISYLILNDYSMIFPLVQIIKYTKLEPISLRLFFKNYNAYSKYYEDYFSENKRKIQQLFDQLKKEMKKPDDEEKILIIDFIFAIVGIYIQKIICPEYFDNSIQIYTSFDETTDGITRNSFKYFYEEKQGLLDTEINFTIQLNSSHFSSLKDELNNILDPPKPLSFSANKYNKSIIRKNKGFCINDYFDYFSMHLSSFYSISTDESNGSLRIKFNPLQQFCLIGHNLIYSNEHFVDESYKFYNEVSFLFYHPVFDDFSHFSSYSFLYNSEILQTNFSNIDQNLQSTYNWNHNELNDLISDILDDFKNDDLSELKKEKDKINIILRQNLKIFLESHDFYNIIRNLTNFIVEDLNEILFILVYDLIQEDPSYEEFKLFFDDNKNFEICIDQFESFINDNKKTVKDICTNKNDLKPADENLIIKFSLSILGEYAIYAFYQLENNQIMLVNEKRISRYINFDENTNQNTSDNILDLL